MTYRIKFSDPIATFSNCFGNAAIVINHSGKVLALFEYEEAKHFRNVYKAARYLLKSGYYMETRRQKQENKIVNPILGIVRYLENGKYQYIITYKSGKIKKAKYPLRKQVAEFMIYCKKHCYAADSEWWF